MGGEGQGAYAYGSDHSKEEVKMPDSGDATCCNKTHGQEGCTKGKERPGTKTIDEASRRQGKEPMDHHSQRKGPCRLPTAPAVFLEDGNEEHFLTDSGMTLINNSSFRFIMHNMWEGKM